jgi:hypothetical protein
MLNHLNQTCISLKSIIQLTKTIFLESATYIENKRIDNRLWRKSAFCGKKVNNSGENKLIYPVNGSYFNRWMNEWHSIVAVCDLLRTCFCWRRGCALLSLVPLFGDNEVGNQVGVVPFALLEGIVLNVPIYATGIDWNAKAEI